ncbi:MAG: T9SS type A sorting domain-containing protein [Calditrichaeota bacterium]|nr:T9SS type A sorting domain-containing protein [Calditrichota bacterium]
MKAYQILLLSFFLFVLSPLFAQNNWIEQSSGTNKSLNKIFMADENVGYIAGDSGLILQTFNGGSDWQKLDTEFGNNLRSVFFADKNNGWCAGENGLIIKTENAGKTWAVESSNTTNNLNGLFFATSETGWCVGNEGIILKTSDSGATWQITDSGADVDLFDISFNTEKGVREYYPFANANDVPYAIAADSQGNVYISIDEQSKGVIKKMTTGGDIEYVSSKTSFLKANDLKFGNDGNLYAAVHIGRLKNITQIDMSGNEKVITMLRYIPQALDIDDRRIIWVAGSNTITRIDENNKASDFSVSGDWRAIRVFNNKLYVGGYSDGIEGVWTIPVISASELGNPELYFNFEQAVSPEAYLINDIEISDTGELFIGFNDIKGILRVNTDLSYDLVFEGKTLGPVYSLAIVDNNKLMASRQASGDSPAAIIRVNPLFTEPAVGWAVGANGTILKSKDGGQSWEKQNSNTNSDLLTVFAVDSLRAWAAGDEGTILKTENGGETWDKISLPESETITSVFFPDENKGYLAGKNGLFYGSEDWGKTWFKYDSVPAININSLWFIDEQKGWIVGENGSIFFTQTGGTSVPPYAPEYRWIAFGSLHNWISNMGSEIEAGRSTSAQQQDGLQWSAIYDYQDMQASKGLWIGVKDFKDQSGNSFDYKVIAIGPRSKGKNVFFPVKFKMISRFEPPVVSVNGVTSFNKPILIDEIDPGIKADHIILNEVNNLLGLTMKRKVLQFTQNYQDNYLIHDYTFINTGNTDNDPIIELPDNTLKDLYIFYLYRWAINKQTRYIIGNGTGWGINTMHDWVGDGLDDEYDVPQEYREFGGKKIRAVWAWHGYFPEKIVSYDNIGGPIWKAYPPYVAEDDTIGRLGAAQFVGVLTLHADVSPSDYNDDELQPSTTGWYGSDLPETGAKDNLNDVDFMKKRYDWMSYGHMIPRHARAVVPDGDYAAQKTGANIDLGSPKSGKIGGFSAGNGYGPYFLNPGDSIRIVWAEAVDGLSREKCIEYGKQYKKGAIDAYTKNKIVLTGKDSLFQTFRRIIKNYNSDYELSRSPLPPASFSVTGEKDHIGLKWEAPADESVQGFRVYRSEGKYNNPDELIFECASDTTTYKDYNVKPGKHYYYYIVSLGEKIEADPELGIKSVRLMSSRFYTQTYDPAFLLGTDIAENNGTVIKEYLLKQNYPNPFNPNTTIEYQLPYDSHIKLTIFNVLGQKVRILKNNVETKGRYKINFRSSGLASGIYFCRLTARSTDGNHVFTKSIKMLFRK